MDRTGKKGTHPIEPQFEVLAEDGFVPGIAAGKAKVLPTVGTYNLTGLVDQACGCARHQSPHRVATVRARTPGEGAVLLHKGVGRYLLETTHGPLGGGIIALAQQFKDALVRNEVLALVGKTGDSVAMTLLQNFVAEVVLPTVATEEVTTTKCQEVICGE